MTQEAKNGNLQARFGRLEPSAHETIAQTPVVVSTQCTQFVVAKYSLPTVENPQRESSSFRSISATVLATLLRSHHRHLLIFDCRYPYEYFGGHIKDAVNIYSLDELEKYLFDEFGVKSTLAGLMPIFYCEFSQVRGPTMARRLRSIDTHRNKVLDFPEIYVLDKGYVNFWSEPERRELCTPEHYISMHSRPHRHALRQYTQHRSKSTAEGRKSKKNQMRVFSTTHLLEDQEDQKEHQKDQKEEVVRMARARTPRTRLMFE